MFNAEGLNAQQAIRSSKPIPLRQPAQVNLKQFEKLVVELTSYDDFLLEVGLRQFPIHINQHWPSFNSIVVSNYLGLSDSLLTIRSVLFIDAAQEPYTETLVSWHDESVNALNAMNSNGALNRMLSIKEKTIDTTDIDFRGRFVVSPLQDAEISQHANQMATIAAGAGNTSSTSKGVAWKSQVSSSSFQNLFPDDDSMLDELEVLVQNHSYGTTVQNYYGIEARAYDQSVIENPERLHVFSIGNAGQLSGSGNYANINGYATATGNFKMAKNVLVVGTHKKDFTIDTRNSRGPAYDGRVLPQLVAYGEDGTSDGAAVVSGLALVVQDEFMQKFGHLPDAAMVKSILIAGSQDIGLPGLDYEAGYGAIHGMKVMQVVREGHVIEGVVPSQGVVEFDVQVPVGTHHLQVALSWLDPAAPSGSSVALVNDVNLELTSPDGSTTWLPWVLSSMPNIDSLQKIARRKVDTINTIEFISLQAPTSGRYTIRVKASVLSTPDQRFALAYRIDEANSFQWTFPYENEAAETGSEIYLRWSTTFTTHAQLHYTIDGSTWIAWDNLIDIAKKFVTITLPDKPGSVKFRMTVSGTEYESNWLVLTPAIELSVGYDCPEKVMLNWPAIEGAVSYTVKALIGSIMQDVFTTTDTVFIFNKSMLPFRHFAVAPLLPAGLGLRSLTYRYDLTGSGCYYRFFTATPSDGAIDLQLQLSTTFGVKDVSFQRLSNVGFEQVAQVVPTTLLAQVNDTDAPSGVLQYRAQIELDDETLVTTDTVIAYLADTNTFSVFPNPAYRGELLTIFTNGQQVEIEFYDASGRKHDLVPLVIPVFKPEVNIDFVPGLYFYRISRNGVVQKNGRLLIR